MESRNLDNGLTATGGPLIAFKDSPIHGTGGFAGRGIKAGVRVIEYAGVRLTKQESLRQCELNNPYLFALDEQFDLDGSDADNPARLLNHSCAPNCEAVLEDGRIWIVALRDLVAGEELTFDYGYDLEDYREHPCRCGASDCVGFIVASEHRDHVRRQQRHSGAN